MIEPTETPVADEFRAQIVHGNEQRIVTIRFSGDGRTGDITGEGRWRTAIGSKRKLGGVNDGF